ncbi:MAG: glycosyltransferase family 4 protein [Deltaproteobacteria bacterium]|nr:glycosyltransferase family 4 protein [Deltaproteobacteria bacterium]
MKIMHIDHNYHYCGGTEQYLLSIIDMLEKRGHQQVVVYSNKTERTVSKESCREYHLPGVTMELNLRQIPALSRIIKEESPDIIYLHNVHNLYALKECLRQRPTIRYIHDPSLCCFTHWKLLPGLIDLCDLPLGLSCLRKGCLGLRIKDILLYLARMREMRLHKKLGKVIVASGYMKRLLIQNGFNPSDIEIISYFVTNPPSTSDSVGVGNRGAGAVFYAGIIHKVKGVDILLKALSFVKTDFKVLLAGQGEYLEEFKRLSRELGLEEKVEFLGWVANKDLMDYYRRADVVVVPSYWVEAFGIVGIEAMACARPVIGFDTGGISEWLKDGVNGFLVPRGSYRELAEKIELLLMDKKLNEEMGMAARRLYEENFTKELHVDKLLSAMENILEVERS